MSTSAAVLRARQDRADLTFRRLLVAAVTLAILVLLSASVATLVLVSQSEDITRWVNHTYQAQHVITDMRVSIARDESARRGYLITHDAFYMSAYRQSATELPRELERFAALTADNPRQQETAARLQPLITAKLNEQEGSLRAASGDAGAQADPATLIRENQASALQIRDALNAVMAEEGRLLGERTEAQSVHAELLLLVVLSSSVLVALLAAGAFLLVRRYAADLDRSQAALKLMNAGLEDEVGRRTADLTRANEEIQRFAYIVSHDLRAPLVNVLGFTSELDALRGDLATFLREVATAAPHLVTADRRAAIEIEFPEALGFIRSSTQKMDRLINAILKLSREGRRTLKPETIDVAALVRTQGESLSHQLSAKGAGLVIEGSLPPLVSDRLAVEQIFSNLLENAVKYLAPARPGRVVVTGRAEGALLRYDVADNGRGVDPKDFERIFDLFRRSGEQDTPGDGIGLATVQNLARRLGGSVAVRSEPGRGSTFSVTLPAAFPRSEDRQDT